MTKHKIIFIGSLSIFVLMIVAFLISPYSTAIFKSKSHFIQHSSTTNVYYEQGAEDYADSIALYLPKAVERVEQVHGLPFEESFSVYVCATQRSMNEYIAANPSARVRGMVLFGDVFIAPSTFNWRGDDTHQGSLLHELSHLHFRQRFGFWKDRVDIPDWFKEGFADVVCDCAGEGISDLEAMNAIIEGHHFDPEDGGNLFRVKSGPDYGLSYPMFHKQTKLFVTFLYHYKEKSFQNFLQDIQNDKSFGESIKNRFGYDVTELWKKFIQQL